MRIRSASQTSYSGYNLERLDYKPSYCLHLCMLTSTSSTLRYSIFFNSWFVSKLLRQYNSKFGLTLIGAETSIQPLYECTCFQFEVQPRSLKNGKYSNLSRKIRIIHKILLYRVPLDFLSFLYPLLLSVKEKGLVFAGGVATFGNVTGISCGPGLSSGL
jgi:hypothetical protein